MKSKLLIAGLLMIFLAFANISMAMPGTDSYRYHRHSYHHKHARNHRGSNHHRINHHHGHHSHHGHHGHHGHHQPRVA
jgi:hypothetical protein